MIVEDDEALKTMLRWEFEDLGYDVTAVGSCRVARSAMRSSRFDMALLDYHLPDGKGTDLITPLRILDPAIPIVVSSGAADRKQPKLAAGDPFMFATKPVAAATIDRLLRRPRDRGRSAG